VPLDERGNVIEHQHARATDPTGASLPNGEDGPPGVWLSVAPEFRWMLAAVVGLRPLDTAQEVVATTTARVAGLLAFCSAGFTCALAALIAAFHVVTTLAHPPWGDSSPMAGTPPSHGRRLDESRLDLA
jgi:hypothetical protein